LLHKWHRLVDWSLHLTAEPLSVTNSINEFPTLLTGYSNGEEGFEEISDQLENVKERWPCIFTLSYRTTFGARL